MIEPVPSQGLGSGQGGTPWLTCRTRSCNVPAPSIGVKESHRVAIVQDWGAGVQPLYDQYDATRLAFEEATARGLLDRPVEVEVLEFEGLPFGQTSTFARRIEDMIREFDPIALIGPHTSENVPALLPHLERWGIPTIAMSGTMNTASPWIFLTPNGTFSDEGILMVDHCVEVFEGQRLGIIREDNLLGDEYAGSGSVDGRPSGGWPSPATSSWPASSAPRTVTPRSSRSRGGRRLHRVRRLRCHRRSRARRVPAGEGRWLHAEPHHDVDLHGHDPGPGQAGRARVRRSAPRLRGLDWGRSVRRGQPPLHGDARSLRALGTGDAHSTATSRRASTWATSSPTASPWRSR